MKKDNLVYLHLILDSIIKIKDFIFGTDFSIFSGDSKTQSAVIMQLQVIGELSKKVSEETKKEINIPWKQIAGLRDMVAHDYFSLDIAAIWKTANESILEAEKEIQKYLKIK